MFVTGILVLVASVIWFLKTLLSWWWDMLRLPPGPTPIPLYGNQTPPDVHPGLVAWYSELREKYGNVFTVYQGTKPTVVVNGYRAITELLIENGNLVHSRPTRDQNVLNFLHNSAGLVWNNNSYRLLRKISSQAIKSFISAYNNTDRSFSNKYDQIDNVLEHLKLSEKEEKGVDLCSPLRGMVSHHICSMLFGLENQEKFPDIMALHCESLGCVINIDSIMHLPLLKYLPKFRDTWAQSISTKQQFYDFLKLQLEEHRRCSEERLCDNFFDMFLRYSHSNGGKAQSLSETDCHATVMQLLLAGLDAVHGTLMWLLLYVSMHEDVQEKLDREIYNQIGYDSKPTVRHMSSTPYCIAVINETLRMSNVAFTSLPYINQQKVVIDGKTIPANTSILVNLVSVNKDPETFENPNKFHPERFMEKNGDLKNIKQFSPFSLGRRACLGESFSKSGIYIVLVSILQKYRLCKIEGVEYSTESMKAFLSTPAPYNLRYVPRCKNTDIHT